ncbi:hypothetical protein [Saccharopolyspora gloriosae]|uniref:hypothetical protein n=1 Tax=Saccharopolyspora gloriosae TaxID=455344 RepID=UPI001FB77262|nr:hypothetical protein [Saccharopolyspora gloriosae]
MQEQWDGLIRDYGKALKRENKSPKTIELYVSTATRFADLQARGRWFEPNCAHSTRGPLIWIERPGQRAFCLSDDDLADMSFVDSKRCSGR